MLQRRLANLYLAICPALSFVAPHCADPNHRQKDGRLRIGFLSANLRTHTIGRLFGGLIGGLDRARFETILFRARAAVATTHDRHYLTFDEFRAIAEGVVLAERG